MTRNPASRLATRFSFLAAGLAIACWAPLVPYAKARVGADDGQLGLILLCLGIGSLLAMPVTGVLSARLGSKPIILGSGLGLVVALPLLALAPNAVSLGASLLLLGAALGSLDVSMNVHAVEVEKQEQEPLMSGFHALYSLGGILGSGLVAALLSGGFSPLVCTLTGSVLVLLLIAAARPRLLPAKGEPGTLAMPHGLVLLLSVLGAICFLVEGAVLDWGALLLLDRKLVAATNAGLGFAVFSVAMTGGRLLGDKIVAKLGNVRVMVLGGVLAVAGICLAQLGTSPVSALLGFLLIGMGASNIVPVLFRLAGTQTVMPVGLAVAALTTVGYAGILAGPAGIGFFARRYGLTSAFWGLALLMALVPLCAKRVNKAS